MTKKDTKVSNMTKTDSKIIKITKKRQNQIYQRYFLRAASSYELIEVNQCSLNRLLIPHQCGSTR